MGASIGQPASQAVTGQPVLATPAHAGIFLTLTVRAGKEDAVREALTDVTGPIRSVAFREPEGGLAAVIGIGSDLWDRLYGAPKPVGLHPFVPLDGARRSAPATPGDLLIHVRAARMDLCFEVARQITDVLAGSVDVADETVGFRYFDQRDLLGFVDGTENPTGAAATAAITIGDEDPAFAGGSYVITQKYLHDLDSWNALTVEEQERVIGRRKLTDIELADDVKPANSHVALNTITDDDGNEREILRLNMPFGSFAGGEFGTYFIGYAATPDVIEQMLRHMFLGDPPGNTDRILDFSTAVTGNLFFVPTADFVDDPQRGDPQIYDAPREPGASDEPSAPGDPADGSLGIGTLKGEKQ